MSEILIDFKTNKEKKETIKIDCEIGIKIFQKIEKNQMDLKSYFLDLINNDISSIIYLKKGFYFNCVDSKLYINKKEIQLSEIEQKVFQLLIDNRNKIVKFEDFKHIWKDKIFLFILKNFIKQIKNKTYSELIEIVPNQGYKLICE